MCGVIGYVPNFFRRSASLTSDGDGGYDVKMLHGMLFSSMMYESRVRGLHAFGIAQPGRLVVQSGTWKDVADYFDPRLPAIAHARYSTSGDWNVPSNNQPIQVGRLALVFNGVIHMGEKHEYEKEFGVQCETDNDGEVFLRRLEKQSAEEFVSKMTGSFAGLWMDLDTGDVRVVRNSRRPLWKLRTEHATWYASTADIFRRASLPGEPTSVEPVV